MDSLTQMALGSCAAAACVSAPQRRQAAVIGAALGTLPDLDVFLYYGDPAANFTMHRGFSHSLPVLVLTGVVLWMVLKNWPPVSWATLFIIDPLYSLPLFAAMLAVMIRPASRAAGRWLAVGLV